MSTGPRLAHPFPLLPQPHSAMARPTAVGFLLALVIAWAPGGLIDRGRQAAAPIQPFASLLAR